MRHLVAILFVSTFLGCVVCPPVDGKKKASNEENKKGNEAEELDDYGLEYGRYLQQVVQLLEEDKDFAKKLENISAEQIRSGHIAKELEFVKHNIRSKLDELKRIEVDRLRKLLQEQMERTELGLYRDEDGRLLESPDGRRWRTIPGHQGGAEGGVGGGGDFWLGIDRKGLKLPQHVDLKNPHSFEVDDLKKLIQTATKDLEELDRQRREEFKKYEMEKELKYRESLKNMTEDQRVEAEKHHKELIEKHKDHPKVHHPGSKPQLEQVWEEEDRMPREEFNPKTFFAMHDLNSDGHLDEKEIEAILLPEVRKMYDPKNEEDDPAEMEEEYHRMREHIFNETDKDKDGLISLEEFIKMTQQQEFQQDDGWKGLDEQSVYSEAELEEYMRQRQMQMGMPYYNDPRLYYDVPNAQGMHPQMNYQYPQQPIQNGMHPQQYQGVPQQQFQGHPQQQQQFQGMHPQQQQQFQGVHPQEQQQFQGMNPQFQGGYPQQQQAYQGVPPQQQQAYQGVPPQQQQAYQGVPPQHQQAYQGVPPQQQAHQGVPPQQQAHQGIPPQQQVQGSPQAHANVPPQQVQPNQPPKPSAEAVPPQAPSVPNIAAHAQQGSVQAQAPSQQQPQKP